MEFDLISRNVAGPGCDPESLDVVFEGCDCEDECSVESGCSCLMYGPNNYDSEGRLINHSYPILECHDNCACSFLSRKCRNRVLGAGPTLKLEIQSTSDYGMCVRAREFIGQNTFIAEYAGEIIDASEVERRAETKTEHNYTLTVKEHFADRLSITYIDPRFRGNISRFFNHSCDPNMFIHIVRTGHTSPAIGLFAARDIYSDEELCYDYGPSLETSTDRKKCLCGAEKCRGFLPASSSATE